MKDHPLFNDDPDNHDRRSRDIGYINIVKYNGTRKQALPNQFEPEAIMTIDDVYQQVGAGRFELIGRDSIKKYIVDRVMLEITDADGNMPNVVTAAQNAQQPAAPQQPQQQYQQPAAPQAFPPIPTAQGSGISIPAGTDPNTALLLVFMQIQSENQKMAREDARAQAQLQMQLATNNMQTMATLVTAMSGRAAPTGADSSAESLLKGVELMSNLYAGMNEGGVGGGKPPVNWGEVSMNIAQSIKGIADLAKATSGGSGPVIPPAEVVS